MKRTLFAASAVLALGLPAPAAAAGIGTFTTSEWYETIYTSDGSPVWFQIHYPAVSDAYGADADPSAGPFPVIAFMHGYGGQAWMYDVACDAFASMGFVVVNLDTETGPFIDTDALAIDAHTALRWADDSSADADHWLAGMVSDDDWTAMGHSMGGIALARLVETEPRVKTIIGFNPYEPEADEPDAYAPFDGSALMLGGTDDTTATPAMVQAWFDALSAPKRALHLSMVGGGHGAIEDLDWGGDGAMDEDLQQESQIAFAEAFLESEVFGDDDGWRALVCDPMVALETAQSNGTDPVTVARATADTEVELSLAGRLGATAVVYVGAGPGVTQVAEGMEIGLEAAVEVARVPLVDGLACTNVTLPDDLAGAAWVQVAFEDADGVAGLGPALDAFAPEGADVEDPGDDTAGFAGGCATTSGSPWLFAAGLLGLASLRRAPRRQ